MEIGRAVKEAVYKYHRKKIDVWRER